MQQYLLGSLLATLASVALAASSPAPPPLRDPVLSGQTVKVSDHIWAIIGFPTIGIVVGDKATLVVDTGLGKQNGATIAKAARQLAPHNRLYLTTTHFHPEHAAGVLGFPADTLLIRDQVQQEEMTQRGEAMVQMFAGRSEQLGSLLSGEQLRDPDATFQKELRLNLGGGVVARLLWFGAAHTRGDELIFVDPDKTLISGDVVQNKVGPSVTCEGCTAASWIAVVEDIAKLDAQHVVPDHSAIGDGSMVAQELTFLTKLRDRALTLKQQGQSAELAGAALTADVRKDYPDWSIGDLTSFVRAAYAEQ